MPDDHRNTTPSPSVPVVLRITDRHDGSLIRIRPLDMVDKGQRDAMYAEMLWAVANGFFASLSPGGVDPFVTCDPEGGC